MSDDDDITTKILPLLKSPLKCVAMPRGGGGGFVMIATVWRRTLKTRKLSSWHEAVWREQSWDWRLGCPLDKLCPILPSWLGIDRRRTGRWKGAGEIGLLLHGGVSRGGVVQGGSSDPEGIPGDSPGLSLGSRTCSSWARRVVWGRRGPWATVPSLALG